MLQNACYCGTTAFSGFYCKVCCSMNSAGTTPSRLTSRLSSERGNRTASKLTPSSSCSSFCTAPSSKNCARSRAKRCGKRKVPTNKSLPSNSAMACSTAPDRCHLAPTARPAGACRSRRAVSVAQRPQANRVCYRPRGSASPGHQSRPAPPSPAQSATCDPVRPHRSRARAGRNCSTLRA